MREKTGSFLRHRRLAYVGYVLIGAIWVSMSVSGLSQPVVPVPMPVSVTGAGATFPAPLYAAWAAAYLKESNTQVNYQPIGSVAGLRQIQAQTVQFGATDVPLTDKQLAGAGLVQFPTVVGGVVPVVNLPNVQPGQLKLTGAILADIYLGRITKWNDAAIVALNPGLVLPDAAISVIHRADGSGTTFLFTNYLSKVSAVWKKQVGEAPSVNWPIGLGGKGNEGVAAFVSRVPYSLGYVEYTYVRQNHMTDVRLSNAAGVMVRAMPEGFRSAAAYAEWHKGFQQILTQQAGPKSWPITGATFIVLPAQERAFNGGLKSVLRFFDWAYKKGDSVADALDYVSLPVPVKNQTRALWARSIKDAEGKILNWQ
jgi:phosphate transport system substrate-binding protein